ncbi:hypothetical protein PTKU46_88980 [Paraburkholderia terrae]|uniref:hypothetical protein n=1 Tax=Paraburkholderia terrae TaxID=311230 RepID=UPI0030E209A0
MNNLSDTRRYRSRAWEHVRASSNRDIHDDFARHLRELVRPLQIAYQRLMSAYGGQPAGVECRLTNRDAWAFVLPDASDEMAWRIQQFDQDGFIGHLCFDTLEEAVEDMLRMGYTVPDAGALDRIGSTDRWAIGVQRAAIMQKHQQGLISYRQMVDELLAVPKLASAATGNANAVSLTAAVAA